MRKLLMLSALLLSACASVQKQPAKYETGMFPAVGERSTVSVGDVMVSQYDYMANLTATLREDLEGGFWAGRRDVFAGQKLIAAMSKGEQVFCLPPGRERDPCFRDTDGDNRFDRAGVFNVYGYVVNWRGVDPVAYSLGDQAILDGFKYELLYQGVENGVARVAYREFTDNLARPAYRQDLTYTLADDGDTEARFRDVTMQIHAADNNSITYTVSTGFAK